MGARASVSPEPVSRIAQGVYSPTKIQMIHQALTITVAVLLEQSRRRMKAYDTDSNVGGGTNFLSAIGFVSVRFG
jgi:hypothetical protein